MLWNPVARNLVETANYALDVPNSVLLLAMLNLSSADDGASLRVLRRAAADQVSEYVGRPWRSGGITAARRGDRARTAANRGVPPRPQRTAATPEGGCSGIVDIPQT